MRKAKKSIVSPRLKFCNETISFQNIESLKKEVTYKLNLQLDHFFFHFLKKLGQVGNGKPNILLGWPKWKFQLQSNKIHRLSVEGEMVD